MRLDWLILNKKQLDFQNLLGYDSKMKNKAKFCTCPSCGKSFDIFSVVGSLSSPQRIAASKKNGALGRRPKKHTSETLLKIAAGRPIEWDGLRNDATSAGISRSTFFRIKSKL